MLDFMKGFSACLEMIVEFLSLLLFMWYSALTDLHMLNHT